MTINVMVIDDSAVVRQTLVDIIDSADDMKVVSTAQDPIIAAQHLRKVVPDVITLDIEMPRMDGLTFLSKLMEQHPLPVLICSTVSPKGSESAIRALEMGAVDIICKPELGTKTFLEESAVVLCDAIRAAAKVRVRAHSARVESSPKLTADAVLRPGKQSKALPKTTDSVICIGASTGGTEAIRHVLEAMPVDCPGICIVQHMPGNFTASFAKRLNDICDIAVKEAEAGDSVLRGQALIAPGNHHMTLKRSGGRYFVDIVEGPLVSRHRPSVDVLFRSAAMYAGQNVTAAILTGMGDDGARGMKELHEAGASTCAQDEATSVVYGMPNEAVKHGGVDKILPLDQVARFLCKRGDYANSASIRARTAS